VAVSQQRKVASLNLLSDTASQQLKETKFQQDKKLRQLGVTSDSLHGGTGWESAAQLNVIINSEKEQILQL
jgi:hypothetical protein